MPSKAPKPEFPPLLPAGLHTLSESDLFTLTVGNFKASTRRAHLWKSLMEFCEEMRCEGLIPARLWLNGSFLTEKTEPDDIDLIVESSCFVVDHSLNSGSKIVEAIVDQKLKSEPRHLHTFLLASAPVMHRDFAISLATRQQWEYDFGHALLSRQPKGIAVLEVGP